VLDLGTGSGVLAVLAAQWAVRVVAVDVNPAAVRCARINVLLHELEACVEIRQGDLFAPLAGERFDVVLFNPPYLNGIPHDDLERAFRAPEVAARFAQGLPDHLQPEGHALLILSTQGDSSAFLTPLAHQGFTITPIAHRNLISETLTIYHITFA
jgi:release factor glutamine methyltransferase